MIATLTYLVGRLWAWGLALNILALVSWASGCPAPWPQHISLAGLALVGMDALYRIIALDPGPTTSSRRTRRKS